MALSVELGTGNEGLWVKAQTGSLSLWTNGHGFRR